MPTATRVSPELAKATKSRGGDAGAQPTVLVIDDSPLCRDTVCKGLSGNGFAVITACDGESGLAQLEKQACVLVLLDNEMPKMNGLAFLKALRANPRWVSLPVVMFTTSNAKAVIVEAIKYKIAGYVLKEHLAMPELLNRVQSAIKQSQTTQPGGANKANAVPIKVPNLVTRDVTLASVADIKTAKTLAGVVAQVKSLLESPRSTTADMAAIVRMDPVVAGMMIQKAAGLAGSKTQLACIDDAVRTVGIAELGAMVESLGIIGMFPEKRADGIDLLRCWQHSFAVASIMNRIVPKTDGVASGLPYLVGLCHDLGEILLRQKFPTEFAAAVDYAAQSGVSTPQMLPGVFGITLAELTQGLLERLKFPALIADPINELFKPNIGWSIDSYHGVLARSLSIANMMAHGMLLTSSADNLVCPLRLTDCRSSLIPSAAMNVAEIQSETVTALYMLADTNGDSDNNLTKPLLPRSEASVLYVRHPGLAHLDPLEVALKSLAKTETRDKVPPVDDLASFNAIVVVAHTAHDPMLNAVARHRAQMARPVPLLKLSAFTEAQSTSNTVAGDGTLTYPLPVKDLAAFVDSIEIG